MGDVARAVSPHMAYQIGQYFKSNDYKNTQDNQNRPGEQSLQHLMAHTILGAATSYATGNDITTGALSAVSSEAAAPTLSKFLFGKDSKELTQDEKDTITNIITLATASTAYAITDGDVANSVSAAEVGKVAVGNNTLKNSDADELLRQIAYARRHYDGVKLDEEMRRIRALAGKLAQDNFKEIQACQNNPTPDCINKIKAEYKDVNFAGLQDAYRKYQGTHTILNGYAYRNNSVISCADSGFADCIVRKDGERVMQEGAYAAIGGVRAGRNQVTVPTNKPSTNVGNQASKGSKDINKTGQATKPTTTKNKATCSSGNVCFTAGTLIHTTDGLKPIENIKHGDLIWSRQEFGAEYDYRPVVATKVTPNQEIYEVVVKHHNNTTEIFKTTSEHPFWVEGIGWLKASLLESGMVLLDKHGLANVTIVSQTKLDHTEIVYNFEVQDFHTYHIGKYGVWVHNDECCNVNLSSPNPIHSKEIRNAYEDIMSGKGVPNLDKNGVQKIYQGRENPKWAGATEWLVPDGGKSYHHRILRMPNGQMGYVVNHDYKNIRAFPSPWYPDGGSVPKKPIKNKN